MMTISGDALPGGSCGGRGRNALPTALPAMQSPGKAAESNAKCEAGRDKVSGAACSRRKAPRTPTCAGRGKRAKKARRLLENDAAGGFAGQASSGCVVD